MIDHEYSLLITKEIVSEFENDRWIYPFANHILYYYLLLKKDKSEYFLDFERKLLSFNPDVLDEYEKQLRCHQFNPPYEDYDLLKDYFRAIKAKSKSFIRLLKKRLHA